MYKDNSIVNDDDTDDDVELIADVGYIASRIKILEQTFFNGYFKSWQNEFDNNDKLDSEIEKSFNKGLGNYSNNNQINSDQQQQLQQQQQSQHQHQYHQQEFDNSGVITTTTATTTALATSVSFTTKQLNSIQKQQLLENLLIKFYEDRERIKQQQQQKEQQIHFQNINIDIMNKSEVKQAIASTSNDDDNNHSDIRKKSLDNSNKSNKLNVDDNNDKFVTSRSEGNIGSSYGNKKFGETKVKSDLKSYSSSGNNNISGGIAKTSSIVLSTSNNNSGVGGNGGAGGGGNRENLVASKSAFKLIRLENTLAQCTFTDDDLRTLVKELKKKVEYTEKMNWLCLSRRQAGPPLRKCSLPKHQEVKKRFIEICDSTFSEEVKAALRLPAFDSYEWEDADVIHLMQTMFIELGLVDKFNIPIITLREWLYEVYKHYNAVPFHNFRHCFCVAQMMYAITRQANLLNRLGDLEVLILFVSCICHDLDHPGYNNIYQINARTELALRYNDISPLENHHCSIAFRLLEHPDCNIFKHFNRETFNFIREGIIRCILATDMARHNEILTQFKEITPIFDYSNRAHINLLCMVLIKVADISNEARPMDVAEPWLDRLLQEFFAQSAAEKSEGLPVTPFMDPDKVSKPGSQVRFIGLVLLPLFEALGDLLPELTDLIIVPVRVALDYYKRLNDAQNKTRKSLVETNENSSDGGGSGSPQLPRSQSGISVRSRRSIPSQKSTSRTSVDEPTCIAAELHDLPEGSESGDSETATEVDVAEKTSKFKVDTESSNRSKLSHSVSRKSSREKRPSMISEMCSSGGRIRNSYGNIHGYHSNRCHFGANRAVSLDQYSSNNRRLSDGLQQVISDSNVFYNRHNRSLDNDGHPTFTTTTTTTTATTDPTKSKIPPEGSSLVAFGEDLINSNTSNPYYDNSCNKQILRQISSKNGSNTSQTGNGNYSHNGAKSWKARFKQITEYFSFGFEKTNKHFSSTRSSPCSLRNNNAEISKQQQGTCCTITNNMSSPRLKQRQDLSNVGRNRAFSLDVPARQRHSSSSGGDSRKSSRNEDNSNKHDLINEDNNSNNTSSGDPPSARIRGGSDGTDQAISLPKVITPSGEGEQYGHDYNAMMVGSSYSGGEVNEGVPRI